MFAKPPNLDPERSISSRFSTHLVACLQGIGCLRWTLKRFVSVESILDVWLARSEFGGTLW